jgi:UDPglucose 6-dehydrogenase
MDNQTLSVIGLGKLGAPMLACLASRGFTVIGLDINQRSLDLLREGRAPMTEPDLEDLLRAHRDWIQLTSDYEVAVMGSDISFIVVPTPSEADGTFSLRHVQAACERIGDVLASKKDFHIVVITSTVLSQDMETVVLPTLERCSRKVCGTDFGLCYNPEFIALGSAVRDMLHPDFILIGESDPRSGTLLENVHRRMVGDHVPILRTTFVNAELAKIAVNTFVTTKISYANMLAEICEHIPGCDVDVVTSAIGLDSRIGPKYLKGRLGYGGPCFPRDNIAFSALARKHGVSATLAEATDTVNRRQITRLVDRVQELVPLGGQVGILGLAYKQDTDVVDESQGVQLAQALAATGVSVIVYDPLAMAAARGILGETVGYAPTADECVRQSHVVVIATPCEEFKQLQTASFAHSPRRVIVDCWRILDARRVDQVADYMTVGIAYPADKCEVISR